MRTFATEEVMALGLGKRHTSPLERHGSGISGLTAKHRPAGTRSGAALDFPGETFRVLKNKEEKAFGEYRTRRLVLAAWGRQEQR